MVCTKKIRLYYPSVGEFSNQDMLHVIPCICHYKEKELSQIWWISVTLFIEYKSICVNTCDFFLLTDKIQSSLKSYDSLLLVGNVMFLFVGCSGIEHSFGWAWLKVSSFSGELSY